VVLTDLQGCVLSANRAFLRMVQAHEEGQVLGRPLADWLGRVAGDAAALIASVRQRGICTNVRLGLRRPELGPLEIELTASLLVEGEEESLGFIVRPSRAVANTAPLATPTELARAMETLASGLGAAPLAELVKRADHLMRRHFVQRALELSASDAAAALLLDVSASQLAELKHELALEALTPKR
jgi:hypothetical protein